MAHALAVVLTLAAASAASVMGYRDLRTRAISAAVAGQVRDDTRTYLLRWLQADPDSPHARELLNGLGSTD